MKDVKLNKGVKEESRKSEKDKKDSKAALKIIQ